MHSTFLLLGTLLAGCHIVSAVPAAVVDKQHYSKPGDKQGAWPTFWRHSPQNYPEKHEHQPPQHYSEHGHKPPEGHEGHYPGHKPTTCTEEGGGPSTPASYSPVPQATGTSGNHHVRRVGHRHHRRQGMGEGGHEDWWTEFCKHPPQNWPSNGHYPSPEGHYPPEKGHKPPKVGHTGAPSGGVSASTSTSYPAAPTATKGSSEKEKRDFDWWMEACGHSSEEWAQHQHQPSEEHYPPKGGHPGGKASPPAGTSTTYPATPSGTGAASSKERRDGSEEGSEESGKGGWLNWSPPWCKNSPSPENYKSEEHHAPPEKGHPKGPSPAAAGTTSYPATPSETGAAAKLKKRDGPGGWWPPFCGNSPQHYPSKEHGAPLHYQPKGGHPPPQKGHPKGTAPASAPASAEPSGTGAADGEAKRAVGPWFWPPPVVSPAASRTDSIAPKKRTALPTMVKRDAVASTPPSPSDEPVDEEKKGAGSWPTLGSWQHGPPQWPPPHQGKHHYPAHKHHGHKPPHKSSPGGPYTTAQPSGGGGSYTTQPPAETTYVSPPKKEHSKPPKEHYSKPTKEHHSKAPKQHYTTKPSKPKPSTYSSQPSGTSSGGYQGSCLKAHNVHRANHSAADLTWSDSLAATAAKIAATCHYAHSMNVNGGGYGQNIAAGVSADEIDSVISNLFYNSEEPLFAGKYGEASPKGWEQWGHFSQVVWKGTTQVGCATNPCSGGLQDVAGDVGSSFTVCNYGPPGNVYPNFASNVGRPLGHPIVDGT